MTNTDKAAYRRLSDEEVRQYSQGEFHEATVIGALAREIAERREASRHQEPVNEPAEWQVEAACKAMDPLLFSDDEMTAHMAASPLKVEHVQNLMRSKVRAALRAASIPKVETGEMIEGSYLAGMVVLERDGRKRDPLTVRVPMSVKVETPSTSEGERLDHDIGVWQMVPVRPTDDMIKAGKAMDDEYLAEPPDFYAAEAIYRAMVAAAPKSPFDAAPQPAPVVTDAARDVLAERKRQAEAEGWTPEHDDQHAHGEMAEAAAGYAAKATGTNGNPEYPPRNWPWDIKWWKPATPRRMLVKAGALILAEIERLDRATLQKQESGE